MRTWVQSLSLVLKVTYYYISCNNIIPILWRQRWRSAECLPASPNQWAPGFFLKTKNRLLLKNGTLFALADTYVHSHLHVHLCMYTFLQTLNHITIHTYKKTRQKNVTHISGSFMVFLFVSTSRFILSGFLYPEITLLKNCHLKLPAHQDWYKSSVGKTWAWFPEGDQLL